MTPIFLLLLLQASLPVADDRCYSAASTQLELNRCAGASLKAADSALATLVRSYEARLTPEKLKLFHSVQFNWQEFRQSSCTFEASGVSGGSAYPMVLAQCMASKAESRLCELKTLATCQEGDLNCPSHDGVAPNNSFNPMPLRGTG